MNLVSEGFRKELIKIMYFLYCKKAQLPSLHCNFLGKFRIALCVAETTCPKTFFFLNTVFKVLHFSKNGI